MGNIIFRAHSAADDLPKPTLADGKLFKEGRPHEYLIWGLDDDPASPNYRKMVPKNRENSSGGFLALGVNPLIDAAASNAGGLNHKNYLDQVTSDTLLKQQQKAVRMPLFNPYQKKMDYSTMKAFSTNVLMTYGAFTALKGLKEVEKEASQAIEQIKRRNDYLQQSHKDQTTPAWRAAWQDYNMDPYWQGKTDYQSARTDLFGHTDAQGVFHQGNYEKEFTTTWAAMRNIGNSTWGASTGIDATQMTELQNLFSDLVRKTDIVAKKMSARGGQFFFIARNGINGANSPLANKATRYGLKNLHPSNFPTPNPNDFYGEIPTLVPPAEPSLLEEPRMPKFEILKLGLQGYIGWKLCGFGLATLGSLFSRTKRYQRGTNSKVTAETSSVKFLDTGRFLANTTGRNATVTAAQRYLQGHSIDSFVVNGLLGIKQIGKALGEKFKSDTKGLGSLTEKTGWRIHDIDNVHYQNQYANLRWDVPPVIETLPTGLSDFDIRPFMKEMAGPSNVVADPNSPHFAKQLLTVKDIKIANPGAVTPNSTEKKNGYLEFTIKSHPDCTQGNSGVTVRALITNDKVEITKQFWAYMAGYSYHNALQTFDHYRNYAVLASRKWGPRPPVRSLGNSNIHAVNSLNRAVPSNDNKSFIEQLFYVAKDDSGFHAADQWKLTPGKYYEDGVYNRENFVNKPICSSKKDLEWANFIRGNVGQEWTGQENFTVGKVRTDGCTRAFADHPGYAAGDVVTYENPTTGSGPNYYACIKSHFVWWNPDVGDGNENNYKWYKDYDKRITPNNPVYWVKVAAGKVERGGAIHLNPQYIRGHRMWHYVRFLEFRCNELSHWLRRAAEVQSGNFDFHTISGGEQADKSGRWYRHLDFNDTLRRWRKWTPKANSKNPQLSAYAEAVIDKFGRLVDIHVVDGGYGYSGNVVAFVHGGGGPQIVLDVVVDGNNGTITRLKGGYRDPKNGTPEVAASEYSGWKDGNGKVIKDNSFKDVDGKGYAHRPLVYIQPVKQESTKCTGSFEGNTKLERQLFPERGAFSKMVSSTENPINSELKAATGSSPAGFVLPQVRAEIVKKAVPLNDDEKKEAASFPKTSWKKDIEDWESVFDHWLDFVIDWTASVDEGNPHGPEAVKAAHAATIRSNRRRASSVANQNPREMTLDKSFGFSYLTAEPALNDRIINKAVEYRTLSLSLKYKNEEFGAEKLASHPRNILNDMFSRMGATLIPPPKTGRGLVKEESITAEEKRGVQSWFSFTPTLGWCQDQTFKNISHELAGKAFTNAVSYGIWSSPKRLKEGLCGKRACGAVQAFTTVPPMGMVDDKATTTGQKTDDAFNVCGNVEITWQFFPTANSYLAGIWGKPKNKSTLSKFLKVWNWFETTIDVSAGVSPKIMSKNGEVTKYTELAAADDHAGSFVFAFGRTTVPSSGNAMLPEIWGNWSDSFTFGDNSYREASRFIFNSLPFGETIKSLGNVFATIFGIDTEGWTDNPDFAITSFLAKTRSTMKLNSFAKVQVDKEGTDFDTIPSGSQRAIPAATEVDISSSIIGNEIEIKNVTFPKNPPIESPQKYSAQFAPRTKTQRRKFPFKPGDKVIFEAIHNSSTGTDWIEGTIGISEKITHVKDPIRRQGTLDRKEFYAIKVNVTAVSGSGQYKAFALKLPAKNPNKALTPIDKTAMIKVNDIKTAYWQERLKRLGWGPYWHEFVKGEALNHLHLEQGTRVALKGFFNDDTWNSIADPKKRNGIRLNPQGLAMYHNRHIVKIIQGFINDLKSIEESEANIHPSRKHGTTVKSEHQAFKELQSVQHNMLGAISQSPYNSFSAEDLQKNPFQQPLTKKRMLSGLCYPRVVASGIDWRPVMVAVSGSLGNDWQPWAHRPPVDAHISFLPHGALDGPAKHKNPYGHTRIALADDNLGHGDAGRFQMLDSQEISTYVENFHSNGKANDDTTLKIKDWTTKNWQDSTQNFFASFISQDHYDNSNSSYQDGTAASAANAKSELRDQIWGDDGNTAINPQDPNMPTHAPALVVNPKYNFRGMGEWAKISADLDEEIGKVGHSFPMMYIDDISYEVFAYKSGMNLQHDGTSDFVPSHTEHRAAANGNPAGYYVKDDAEPIDLDLFAHHYTKGKEKLLPMDDKRFTVPTPLWTHARMGNDTTKYASLWEYAYSKAIGSEGRNKPAYSDSPDWAHWSKPRSWFIRGDGNNAQAAFDDASGKHVEYTELINKFHYTGDHHSYLFTKYKDMDTEKTVNGHDWKAVFTGVGFGHTAEEATADAYKAMGLMAASRITGDKPPYHNYPGGNKAIGRESTAAFPTLPYRTINNHIDTWDVAYSDSEFEAAGYVGWICGHSGYHNLGKAINADNPNIQTQFIGEPLDNSATLSLANTTNCPSAADTWTGVWNGTCSWELDQVSKDILHNAQGGEERPLVECPRPVINNWTDFTLRGDNDGIDHSRASTSVAKLAAVQSLKAELLKVSGQTTIANFPTPGDSTYCDAVFSGTIAPWLGEDSSSNEPIGVFDWRKMSTGNPNSVNQPERPTTNPWWSTGLNYGEWAKNELGGSCPVDVRGEVDVMGKAVGYYKNTLEDPCRLQCATGISKLAASGSAFGNHGDSSWQEFKNSDTYKNIMTHMGYQKLDMNCYTGDMSCVNFDAGLPAWGYDHEVDHMTSWGDKMTVVLNNSYAKCYSREDMWNICSPVSENLGLISGACVLTAGEDDGQDICDNQIIDHSNHTSYNALKSLVEAARLENFYRIIYDIENELIEDTTDVYLADWVNTGNYITDGTDWQTMFHDSTTYTESAGQGETSVPLLNTDLKNNPANNLNNLHSSYLHGLGRGQWFTDWSPSETTLPTLEQYRANNSLSAKMWNRSDGDSPYSESASSAALTSLSFFEQVYTGTAGSTQAGSTDPDGTYYFSGVNAWAVVKDQSSSPSSYWQCCYEVECDNYEARLTGAKPVYNTELKRAVVTGVYSGKYEQHTCDVELLRSQYSGVMYASGWIPYVTGRADWSNSGMYENSTVVNGKTIATPIITEQAYTYHLGEDSFVDVSMKRVNGNGPIGTIEAQSLNQMRGLRGTTEYVESGNLGKIAGLNAKELGDNEKLVTVQYNVEGVDISAGREPTKGHKNNKGIGDTVFMGGWPLVNPAWPSDIPAIKSNEVKAQMHDILGSNRCILLVNQDDLEGAFGKKGANRNGTVSNEAKAAMEITVRGANALTPTGMTYIHNRKNAGKANKGFILEVFWDATAFSVYINTLQSQTNILKSNYNQIQAPTEPIPAMPGLKVKSKTNKQWKGLDCVVYEFDSSLSVCERCTVDPLKSTTANTTAKGDFRKEGHKKPVIMFGEQFMVGMRHKWDMRSGNFEFEVPYTDGNVVVHNPTNPKQPLTLKSWHNYVLPKDGQDKYDPRLARTGYTIVPGTANNPWPPGLSCTESFGKIDRVADFRVATNRSWAEIPAGGMVEVANFNNADLPVYLGAPDTATLYGTAPYQYDHPNYIDLRKNDPNWANAAKGITHYYQEQGKLGAHAAVPDVAKKDTFQQEDWLFWGGTRANIADPAVRKANSDTQWTDYKDDDQGL